MCKYCEGIKEHKNLYISGIPDVVIDEISVCPEGTVTVLKIAHSENSDNAQMFFDANININFCPMCGRDLRKEEPDGRESDD